MSFATKQSGTKKYLANTSWLLASRGITMLVSFFIGAWLARYLGPEQYGIYNYVISYTGIFLAFSTLGLGTIIVKDMLNNTFSWETILGSSLLLRFSGSIISCILILICSFITQETSSVRLLLLLASLQPVARSFEVISSYFQAKVQSKFTVIAQLISLTIISLLKIIFILQQAPLIWFIYLLALDSAIVSIILIFEYRSLKQKITLWRWDFSVAKSLLKESWPLIFSGMLATIYLKIDQVMIGNMLDKTAVGIYAAAVKISEAWLTIPWIISGSLYPALVNAHKTNEQSFLLRVKQLYIILIGVALIVVIPISIFSPFVTQLIFGSNYTTSSTALRLHIISSLFIFMGSLNNRWLILEGIQKYWMINSALGALTNILLNLILIPAMGINGAALATLISYALAYHFIYAMFPKTRMIFYEQNASFIRTISIFPAIKLIRQLPAKIATADEVEKNFEEQS